jgi:hypothetical protein
MQSISSSVGDARLPRALVEAQRAELLQRLTLAVLHLNQAQRTLAVMGVENNVNLTFKVNESRTLILSALRWVMEDARTHGQADVLTPAMRAALVEL